MPTMPLENDRLFLGRTFGSVLQGSSGARSDSSTSAHRLRPKPKAALTAMQGWHCRRFFAAVFETIGSARHLVAHRAAPCTSIHGAQHVTR